jgi:hypothetical protein
MEVSIMPSVVEVPKIERVFARRGSKYLSDPSAVDEAAKLLLKHQGTQYIGEFIEPVDTIVKARIAANIWKEALAEKLDKPKGQFKTRVYTKGEDLWTFALALQYDPAPEDATESK